MYLHLYPSHSISQRTLREIHNHANGVPLTGLGSRLFWQLFITGTVCVVDAQGFYLRMVREHATGPGPNKVNEFEGLSGYGLLTTGLWRIEVLVRED